MRREATPSRAARYLFFFCGWIALRAKAGCAGDHATVIDRRYMGLRA
jgi:hypothetical protein